MSVNPSVPVFLQHWFDTWENVNVDFDFTGEECRYTFDYGVGITGIVTITANAITYVLDFGQGDSATYKVECQEGIECDRRYDLALDSFVGGVEVDFTGSSATFNNGRFGPVGGCTPP